MHGHRPPKSNQTAILHYLVPKLKIALLVSFLLAIVQLYGAEVIPSKPARALQLTRKDVLSLKNGRFYLDGNSFAEISFNKFDLFWELYDQLAKGEALNATNPMVKAQDRALRNLHELGFKSIRIFALPWGPAGPAS